PVKPVGPVSPAGPVKPVGPVLPVGPVKPVGPVSPAGPVKPVGPVLPVGPVGIVNVGVDGNVGPMEVGSNAVPCNISYASNGFSFDIMYLQLQF
ncbi:hypothetical protein PDJ95_29740, partial [Bacillus cereus]|nr:hypothetical protein [Bacillus cereus]